MQRERLVDAHGRSRLRRNDEASRASAVGTPPSNVVHDNRLRLLLSADDLDNDVDLRGFLREHVSVDGAPLSDIILRHKVCRPEATALDFRHLEGFQRLPHALAHRTQRRIEGFGRRARRRPGRIAQQDLNTVSPQSIGFVAVDCRRGSGQKSRRAATPEAPPATS